MPETQGQTREGQSQISMDRDNEEMQESETLLGQGEQPGEDVTKKEEETEKVPREAKEERPEKVSAQSTDEQATSGPDEVRIDRGSAGLFRKGERRQTDKTSGKGKGKGNEEKENMETREVSVAREHKKHNRTRG